MLETVDALGLKFYVLPNDDTISAALRDSGEFAKPESDLIRDYMTAVGHGVLIDVGANLGAISLPVAKACPQSMILAIEANRSMAGVLVANVHLNGLGNVEVYHAAAGRDRGLTRFPDPTLQSSGNLGAIHAQTPVRRMTPTRLLKLDEFATADVRFVKIDVEGHEPDVLRGASRLLNEVRPVFLIEANPSGPRRAESAQILLDAGYELFWFFAPFRTPTSERRVPSANDDGDMNYLALPPGVPRLWDLPRAHTAEDERPAGFRSYPYMARYGF
ncbi:FkbM family methyltransferase [Phenylobacterium sp.]|uniref:FkbM family methyltransferase n=1 Tax=Phenylobacterium sp. TaxID=1871053 RepID=UPI003D2C0AD9